MGLTRSALDRHIGLKLAGMAALVMALGASVLLASSTYFAERLGRRAIDASESALRAEADRALENATRAELLQVDNRLERIAGHTRATARMAEQLMHNREAYGEGLWSPALNDRRKGFLTNDASAPASVVAWGAPTLDAAQRERIRLFSHLDPLLTRVRDHHDAIQAAWTMSEVRTSRYVGKRHLVSFAPSVHEEPPHQAIFYEPAAPQANPEQSTTWSPVYRSGGQELMVTVVTPFHRPGDGMPTARFAGVVGVDVTLESMVDTLVSTSGTTDGQAPDLSLLVDGRGRLIAAPPPKWDALELGSPGAPEPAQSEVVGRDLAESGNAALARMAEAIAEGRDPGRRSLTLGGRTYLASVQRIPATDWRYINLVSKAHVLRPIGEVRNEIDADVRAITWQLGLLMVAVALMTVGSIVVYVQWSTVGPLRRLADAARRLGAGDYSVPLASTRRDEFGEVSQAFDQMSREIGKQIETLDARVAERTRELEEQARTDPLTGLANRRHIMDLLEIEHERNARHGSVLSVVLLDLDFFKEINDRYGHDTGDNVLAAVAAYLQQGVRSIDTVGRLGGEEMVILLPQTNAEAAYLVAKRLSHDLATEVAHRLGYAGESEFVVTASFGIATTGPGNPLGRDELLKRADDNCYRAKEAGRNCIIAD